MVICIFCGPTISYEEARTILNAECFPPVCHGDVYRVVRSHSPDLIGIIDGQFFQTPSVWHKEILWAMEQGVHVFGAASMGALRAAELDSFGMVGVGKIYNAYRSGVFVGYEDEPFEDDDEVAVLHGPAELNYVASCEALVNIRETLACTCAEGVINRAERDALIAALKREFYPQRSYHQLLDSASRLGLSEKQIEQLRQWLASNTVDLKRRDAVALLTDIHEFVKTQPGRKEVHYQFQHTDAWSSALDAIKQVDSRNDWLEVRGALFDVESEDTP